MPLEAVLAMYGYSAPDEASSNRATESSDSTSEEEILNNRDLTLDKEEVGILHSDGYLYQWYHSFTTLFCCIRRLVMMLLHSATPTTSLIFLCNCPGHFDEFFLHILQIARDVLQNNDGSECSTIDELIEGVDSSTTARLLNGELLKLYKMNVKYIWSRNNVCIFVLEKFPGSYKTGYMEPTACTIFMQTKAVN